MTKPSGLEYCVRDKHRTVVVPFRPSEALWSAIETYRFAATHLAHGGSGPMAAEASASFAQAKQRVRALLGLGDDDDQR